MNLDQYFTNGFENFLILTVFVMVIYTIIWTSVEKKIREYNRRFPEKEVSVLFVSSAVRAAFFIIGLLIIMYQIIPLRPAIEIILDASGILALCAAFAARESFGNYIAGFLLTVHKPFKIGDRISLQQMDITGTVKDISFRHTVIESDSGSIITVPNSIMNTVAIEDLPEIKPKRQSKKKK
ncbi:MAG: mechanosensitive ion channel [Erysipelotrichaceae bacterium]|nr:mechanosensitive ion channel [Erysipelotrichaceae bacterium]